MAVGVRLEVRVALSAMAALSVRGGAGMEGGTEEALAVDAAFPDAQQGADATRFEIDLDLTTVDADLKLPIMAMAIDVAVTSVDPLPAKLKLDVIAATVHARDASDPKKNPAIAVMERQSKLLAGLVVTYALTPRGRAIVSGDVSMRLHGLGAWAPRSRRGAA